MIQKFLKNTAKSYGGQLIAMISKKSICIISGWRWR